MNKSIALTRLIFLLLLLALRSIYAGSATWRADAQNKRWVNTNNWTPATVPNGPGDTASFAVSNITAIALPQSPIELDGIVFNSGAGAFGFTVRNAASLLLS